MGVAWKGMLLAQNPSGSWISSMFGRRWRHRFVIARAALCAVAVLTQTTIVPVAHALHIDSSRAPAAAGLHRDAGGAAAHDAATCALCATLTQCRADRAPVGWHAPALLPVPGAPAVVSVLVIAGAARTASGPRAPPILSA